MDNEADDRGDFWYAIQRPIVLSLLGRKDEALQALRVSVERSDMHYNSWYFLEIDPTIAGLRSDARFIELRNTVRTSLARQRQRLAELRSGGLIPLRP